MDTVPVPPSLPRGMPYRPDTGQLVHRPPPVPNEGKAVAAFALGVTSLLCLGAFTGLPAIILGALARRDIERSGGAVRGGQMAASGIVLGLFGTGLSLLVAAFALSGLAEAFVPSATTETAAPVAVPVAAGTHAYGSLVVVDLDESESLRAQLAEQLTVAAAKHRTVVLQTYAKRSRECAEIAASLPDRRMHKALAGVTLLRVDVEAYEDELRAMRVDTEQVPWFYKLDSAARPTDAVSADEWDENVPENMAPVLGAFVHGTLGPRRTPSGFAISL